MSNASVPAAVTVPAATPAVAKPAETLASKVQKHVDGLQAKIVKLSEENAALKAQLHSTRASNSRIRRIPKKAEQ
jgi:hypothetical protein